MRAISSLRDITMRVLIVSALFACAAAAPSYFAPLPLAAVAIPTFAVGPTIPPGDIQAAAIDAQVKAADQARSLADQARELAEQAVENQNEGVNEANDLSKEKSEEAFWAAEEKKWQAMNNAQVAEAKVDASVASSSDDFAKAYDFTGVVPGIPAASAVAPGVTIESASSDDKDQAAVKSEVTEVKAEEEEAVKSAEAENTAEEKPAEEKPIEEEKKDDAAEVKSATTETLNAENAALQHLKLAYPLPVAVAPAFNYHSYVAPISYQPAFRTFPINTFHPYSGPVYSVKSYW